MQKDVKRAKFRTLDFPRQDGYANIMELSTNG
jgi:hypothetical protein